MHIHRINILYLTHNRKIHMTYYESSEDIIITRRRVIEELEEHGVTDEDQDLFFEEIGNRTSYDAQEVLEWLGY